MSKAYWRIAGATQASGHGLWLLVFRRYMIMAIAGHVAWELLHLPLYVSWQAETALESALFLAGCIIGDVSIALGALVASLLVVNEGSWPLRGYAHVASYHRIRPRFHCRYRADQGQDYRRLGLFGAYADHSWHRGSDIADCSVGRHPAGCSLVSR
jgi:hypothetical protein